MKGYEHIDSIPQLNVGALVRAKMFERGINKARLARNLNRDATGIKRLIYRSSMQTYILWEISVALRHNFFADLAHQLDAATEGRLDSEQTELQQLKAEYQRLKEERDYLRKALDMLHPKT